MSNAQHPTSSHTHTQHSDLIHQHTATHTMLLAHPTNARHKRLVQAPSSPVPIHGVHEYLIWEGPFALTTTPNKINVQKKRQPSSPWFPAKGPRHIRGPPDQLLSRHYPGCPVYLSTDHIIIVTCTANPPTPVRERRYSCLGLNCPTWLALRT